MKELSIEEKAKRYDEAIKKVNDYYEGKTKLYSNVDKTLDYLFPALFESEDERMLREIKRYIKEQGDKPTGLPNGNVAVSDMLAWLEKQDRENIIESLRLEYERGKADALQEQRKEWTAEDLLNRNQIADILQEYNRGDLIKWLEKQGEQKPARSKEDEKMRNAAINACKYMIDNFENSTKQYEDAIAWLEKQDVSNKVSIWKHWKDGIAGNGDGKQMFLIKSHNTYNLSSCLSFECDYIELSELEKLMEKKDESKFEQCIQEGDEIVTNEDGTHFNVSQLERVAKKEPKFKVGDWVVREYEYTDIITINQVVDVKRIDDEDFGYTLDDETYFSGSLECSYHLWTIQDAKDGDVLATDKSSVFIYAKVLYNKPYAYCGVDKFGVFKDNCLEHDWTNSVDSVHPATKEQHGLLFQKMKEAGYEWDAEKKELKKVEQNPAWSEEDEIGLGDALWAIKQARTIAKDENEMGNLWYAEKWLKSLKDRVQPQNNTITSDELAKAKKEAYNDALDKIEYHSGVPSFDDGWSAAIWYLKKKNIGFKNTWKPSEEHIRYLQAVVNDVHNIGSESCCIALRNLLEQLKKL